LPVGVGDGFAYRVGQLPEFVGRHGLAHYRELIVLLATGVAEHHRAQRADPAGVAVGAGAYRVLQRTADPAFLVEQVVGLMLVRLQPATERTDDCLLDDLVDGDQPRQLAERRVPVVALAVQHVSGRPCRRRRVRPSGARLRAAGARTRTRQAGPPTLARRRPGSAA
jgi:hypothetical protein